MVNILQLTNKDIINIQRIADIPAYRRLRPLELTTQRGWAVGLNAKNITDYTALSDIAAALNAAATLDVVTATDYVGGNGANNSKYWVKIDTRKMFFTCDTRYQRSIQAPSDVRQVFNVISGDQGLASDPVNNRHRSELNGGDVTFTGGTELWLSSGLKVNSMGILNVPGAFAITGQWHGNDEKTPPLSFNFKDGKPGIWTTSSALLNGVNGVLVERWRASTAWVEDDQHYVVIRMKTGDETTAILQVWIDGVLVLSLGPGGVGGGFADGVCEDGIGYYLIVGNATYFNYGLYCADYLHPDILQYDIDHPGAGASAAARAAVSEIEYANVEYGTTNLSDRILNPLPI